LATIFFALLIKVYFTGKLFREALIFIYWVTAAFTIISGADYLMKGMKTINRGDGNREKA
jgi:phosphatidylglycerophosphate synthase